MGDYRRIHVSDEGGIALVRFIDRRILDEVNIQQLGMELTSLIEKEKRQKVLLNFSNVEFMSSAALGKLVSLDKTVRKAGGALKLCNIRPEIYEVFKITNLNQVFQIHDSEEQAIKAFK